MIPAFFAGGAGNVGDGAAGVDDEGEFLGRSADIDPSSIIPVGEEVIIERHLSVVGDRTAGGEASVAEERVGFGGAKGGIGGGENKRQEHRRRLWWWEGRSGHRSGEEEEDVEGGGQIRHGHHCQRWSTREERFWAGKWRRKKQ